ncbi:predicted protein [Nematostella vectensis]|uniref:Ferritin n=1 Tax=Nematostella vectensis TaxID=45351 RepID=A7S8I5_NEMVE|nr:predicted protein [Nematostella vectensis]|eukprot:XP_001632010.1 predicted protein [Nematostella vectensis]
MAERERIARAFVLLLAVQAVVLLAQGKSCRHRLADHIRGVDKWTFDPPKNIYGKERNVHKQKSSLIVQDFKGNGTSSQSPAWIWANNDIEAGINKQINRELFAHYTYLSMAAHFGRDDIHLPGFAAFFKKAAEEEYTHAHMFMEFLNKRGGRVKLHHIMKPCRDHWGNGLMAMRDALYLEKEINHALLDLHQVADTNRDPQVQDFLESNFLGEQVDSIKTLANYVSTLQRLGGGLGEYQFDKETLGAK